MPCGPHRSLFFFFLIVDLCDQFIGFWSRLGIVVEFILPQTSDHNSGSDVQKTKIMDVTQQHTKLFCSISFTTSAERVVLRMVKDIQMVTSPSLTLNMSVATKVLAFAFQGHVCVTCARRVQ